jgi:hypothetical protein
LALLKTALRSTIRRLPVPHLVGAEAGMGAGTITTVVPSAFLPGSPLLPS